MQPRIRVLQEAVLTTGGSARPLPWSGRPPPADGGAALRRAASSPCLLAPPARPGSPQLRPTRPLAGNPPTTAGGKCNATGGAGRAGLGFPPPPIRAGVSALGSTLPLLGSSLSPLSRTVRCPASSADPQLPGPAASCNTAAPPPVWQNNQLASEESCELWSSSQSDSDTEQEQRLEERRTGRNRSPPEREIDENDTETAELQVKLRQISGRREEAEQACSRESSGERSREDSRERLRERGRECGLPERELSVADTETAALQCELRRMAREEPGLEPAAAAPGRAAVPARGRVGVRRSRTSGDLGGRSWQGFSNGLRYESVTDAGMPPPPGPPIAGRR